MKRLSRLLVLLLILAMMMTTFSVTGFATEKDESLSHYANGTGYLAFGDSVTRGYALPNWDEEGYEFDKTINPNCRNVTGSYPKIIADTLGCYTPNNITNKNATYWPIAQDGLTTSMLLDLFGVDDSYYDSLYMQQYEPMRNRYCTDLYYFGDEHSFTLAGDGRYGKTGVVYSIRDLVANSSLITIQIGMSDVLNRPSDLAEEKLEANGGDYSDVASVVSAVGTFFAEVFKGYERWERDFPKLLDYINDNSNDDATVVIIGAYNPMYAMTVTEEIPVQIGTLMTTITNLMNQQYRYWAQKYGFLFVDISNVEIGAAVNETNVIDFLNAPYRDQGIATHPTEEGYQQIARLVLNALRENDAEQKTRKSTIKVDLGIISQQAINYVSVNGIKLPRDAYSIQDYVLTIPNILLPANRLTVSAVGEDGKVYYSRYDLDYNLRAGYVATRIYSTTDAAGIFKR